MENKCSQYFCHIFAVLFTALGTSMCAFGFSFYRTGHAAASPGACLAIGIVGSVFIGIAAMYGCCLLIRHNADNITEFLQENFGSVIAGSASSGGKAPSAGLNGSSAAPGAIPAFVPQ